MFLRSQGAFKRRVFQIEEIGIELDCENVSLIDDEDGMYELVCESRRLSKVENALIEKGLVLESFPRSVNSPLSVAQNGARNAPGYKTERPHAEHNFLQRRDMK